MPEPMMARDCIETVDSAAQLHRATAAPNAPGRGARRRRGCRGSEPGDRAEREIERRATVQLLAAVEVFETLVDDPSGVEISSSKFRQRASLHLSVAPDDMGKVIGRKGRTAQAIRTIVRAAGSRDGLDTFVEIVD